MLPGVAPLPLSPRGTAGTQPQLHEPLNLFGGTIEDAPPLRGRSSSSRATLPISATASAGLQPLAGRPVQLPWPEEPAAAGQLPSGRQQPVAAAPAAPQQQDPWPTDRRAAAPAAPQQQVPWPTDRQAAAAAATKTWDAVDDMRRSGQFGAAQDWQQEPLPHQASEQMLRRDSVGLFLCCAS